MAKRFAGTHEHKVEARGRVSIPSDFRKVFRDLGCSTIYLVPLRKPEAHVCFTETGFEAFCDAIRTGDLPPEKKRKMVEYFNSSAKLLEPDEAGRIVIPEDLRAAIGVTKDVVFVGLGDTFEIRSPEAHARRAAEIEEDVREAFEDFSAMGLH